jgi:signal transduction histidine kinase
VQVFRHIVDELQVSNPNRELILDTEGSCWGEWDPDRLAQAVGNLVGNAVQHGSPGTPVRVALRSSPDQVVLEISNFGPPIPADVLPRIFEPFSRGEQGPGQRSQGLGLGLYIVRAILDAHGGSIDVRSTEGEGTTTFTVRLPRWISEPRGAEPLS